VATTEPPLTRDAEPIEGSPRRARRLRNRARRVRGFVRRAPVTYGLVVVLWIVGGVTGPVRNGRNPELREMIGAGLSTLATGRWWTPLTSGLWTAGPISLIAATALLLLLVAPAERRIGSWRTALLMVLTQVLGAVVGLALVALGALATDAWAERLATDIAVGPSSAAVGVTLAASTRLGPLWRRRLRVVVMVVLAMLALYSGFLQDVLRVVAGLTGLALGPLLLGRQRRRASLVVSGPEVRTLVALVVAASAVGPLAAALSGTAIGPLSVLRFLVLPPPPDPATVAAICADPATVDDCGALGFRLRLGGVGPAIMSVLPVLVLLVLADGLRRGRRFAWRGALGINLLFAALGAGLAVLTASTPTERLIAFGGATDAQFYSGVVTSVLQPLAIAALLLLSRSRFGVTGPPGSSRGWAITLAATFAVVSVCYVVAGFLLRDQFTPIPTWADLLADLPTRFLPPATSVSWRSPSCRSGWPPRCSTSGPASCSGSSRPARRCGCCAGRDSSAAMRRPPAIC
jgi:phosphatidylglycerol lysyltransferase